MSNESEQVAGYVPSAEAVTDEQIDADLLADHGYKTFERYPEYSHGDLRNAYRSGAEAMQAALSAAVPVEVARLLREVLPGVRVKVTGEALLYAADDGTMPLWDADDEDMRAVRDHLLDTVGVPAQVEPASEEGIERAARVLFLHDYETGRDWSFDQSTEQEREAYRETARAMFAVASSASSTVPDGCRECRHWIGGHGPAGCVAVYCTCGATGPAQVAGADHTHLFEDCSCEDNCNRRVCVLCEYIVVDEAATGGKS